MSHHDGVLDRPDTGPEGRENLVKELTLKLHFKDLGVMKNNRKRKEAKDVAKT